MVVSVTQDFDLSKYTFNKTYEVMTHALSIFTNHVLDNVIYLIDWCIIEGWLRTNTFLQAFISQSVHFPSEN